MEQTTWSHTRLEALFECGERYRLVYRRKAPRRPAWWFVAGATFHTAAQTFDLLGGDIVGHAEKAWDSIMAEAAQREPDHAQWLSAARGATGETLRQQVLEWCRTYEQWRQQNGHLRCVHIEHKIEFTVAGKPFICYIDRTFVDTKTGEPLLVDLKTGSRKPESVEQLQIYARALAAAGFHCGWGAFYLARTGELTTPVRLDENYATLDVKVKAAQLLDDANLLVPHPGRRCATCDVAQFCTVIGGAQADQYRE
ncbi:MAG: PD-(D/E)XK nuclease family protein [Nevskia sp.]|nr:PD-(D/E)XK nuclease family protein [Nevskia sp.]